MNRWDDPAALAWRKKIAMRELEKQGLVFSDDPVAWAALREIFTSVFLCLHREIMERGRLALVYYYDMDTQPPEISKCDGYSSVSERQSDGQRVSSVGVSVQALRYGRDYGAMILLHELAHTLSGFPSEHGPEFHAYLDGLIGRYNRATGAFIVNDYQGLSKTAVGSR